MKELTETPTERTKGRNEKEAYDWLHFTRTRLKQRPTTTDQRKTTNLGCMLGVTLPSRPACTRQNIQ